MNEKKKQFFFSVLKILLNKYFLLLLIIIWFCGLRNSIRILEPTDKSFSSIPNFPPLLDEQNFKDIIINDFSFNGYLNKTENVKNISICQNISYILFKSKNNVIDRNVIIRIQSRKLFHILMNIIESSKQVDNNLSQLINNVNIYLEVPSHYYKTLIKRGYYKSDTDPVCPFPFSKIFSVQLDFEDSNNKVSNTMYPYEIKVFIKNLYNIKQKSIDSDASYFIYSTLVKNLSDRHKITVSVSNNLNSFDMYNNISSSIFFTIKQIFKSISLLGKISKLSRFCALTERNVEILKTLMKYTEDVLHCSLKYDSSLIPFSNINPYLQKYSNLTQQSFNIGIFVPNVDMDPNYSKLLLLENVKNDKKTAQLQRIIKTENVIVHILATLCYTALTIDYEPFRGKRNYFLIDPEKINWQNYAFKNKELLTGVSVVDSSQQKNMLIIPGTYVLISVIIFIGELTIILYKHFYLKLETPTIPKRSIKLSCLVAINLFFQYFTLIFIVSFVYFIVNISCKNVFVSSIISFLSFFLLFIFA